MQLTQLDARTFVGPQISVADIQGLGGLGIRTIIVARPEGEAADQPAIATFRDAADALGIGVHQIPVIAGEISDTDVRSFGAIMSGTDGPVLAYCRSGMRAASLWALNAAAQGRPLAEILDAVPQPSYDLTALLPRLRASAANAKTR